MVYRPTPRQLEYLVALGETGHFGEAARKCHVSQPTLSVQVAQLEKQLGVTLIERLPGQVMPTPVGAEVIAAAKVILNGLDELRALASSSKNNLGGAVRLGVAPSFGPYFLPYLLPRLHARYKDLKIYIREERPRLLEKAVLQGEIDCGLGPVQGLESGLDFKIIHRERIFVGVPRGHHLASRSGVRVSELKGEKLLSLGPGHRLLDDARNLAVISGAFIAEDYEGSSLDALRQMVSIEMGISLFPELYVRSEFAKDEGVALIDLEDWQGERDIGFFWRSSSARAAHFRTLADLGQQVADTLSAS
ncbi:LysR substrate-binding domain-containing protein [Ciceribacter sp. L1K22]|uniref:LysR substrate-binding domain-containing protein n=1 Tax=Ciceribacter sp. L1K22 TaxID=2820275 RepID=UPI001ABE514E|nr:LysR substrate-binding domain-containing protein [Ciceribacter sp. L1K22]MBO3758123.1 LysR family transcriptional regulator [Ciceribacter sp. L1K22]